VEVTKLEQCGRRSCRHLFEAVPVPYCPIKGTVLITCPACGWAAVRVPSEQSEEGAAVREGEQNDS